MSIVCHQVDGLENRRYFDQLLPIHTKPEILQQNKTVGNLSNMAMFAEQRCLEIGDESSWQARHIRPE